MKLRKEKSGAHYFNRKTGSHVLLDEISFNQQEISRVPRTMSIAITDKCNQSCDYCYCTHGVNFLEVDYIIELAKYLDQQGCLEITIGGGEPFLHPNIAEICNQIWTKTALGLSITTNGQLIYRNVLTKIKDNISSIRISVDVLEPEYSNQKIVKLEHVITNIIEFQNEVNFGINIIVRVGQVELVKRIIDYFDGIKIMNFLLIPEHKQGKFVLSNSDWDDLNNLINEYRNTRNILVTYDACENIDTFFLQTEEKDENLFMHLSADKILKSYSYLDNGIELKSKLDFSNIIK